MMVGLALLGKTKSQNGREGSSFPVELNEVGVVLVVPRVWVEKRKLLPAEHIEQRRKICVPPQVLGRLRG
jgi:hypothetical protein